MKRLFAKLLSLALSVSLILAALPIIASAQVVAIDGTEAVVASPTDAPEVSPEAPPLPAPVVTITIEPGDLGDTTFRVPQGVPIAEGTLLLGVSAEDENGEAMPVTVADTGGLDLENPQPKGTPGEPLPYIITYSAEGAEDLTRECYVTVGVTTTDSVTIDLSNPPVGVDFTFDGVTITYKGAADELIISGNGPYNIVVESISVTDIIIEAGTEFGVAGVYAALEVRTPSSPVITVTGGGSGIS